MISVKPANDLFELICQMSKNEKRFFVLSSGLQKGDKIYLELFKAMEKQTEYDENKFRLKNKGKKFLNNFAYNKNHLYKLIMKSLINYNYSTTADGKMHSLIAECWVLFNKAMYKRYFKTLAKAKEYAYKYEKYGYLLQILDMEKIIIPKKMIQKTKSEELMQEVYEAAEKMVNIFEYSKTAGMLLNNFRYYGLSRNEKHTEGLDKITGEGKMLSPENAKSIRALEAYHRVKEIYYGIKADNINQYRSQLARYKIVTENPLPFRDYILHYPINILYSLTESCIYLDKTVEAESYLKILYNEVQKEKFSTDDFEIFRDYLYLKIYLKQGEIQKAARMIPRLEKVLVRYKDKLQIDTELSILYHITVCRIEEKNFTKALTAANRILSHPLLNKRSDYECYIKILYLIIHFELKNYELLRYLLISTYRYLRKHEKLFKTELLIIKFIRRLQGVKTEDDLNFLFSRLSKNLEKLKKDRYEKNAFEYFDLLKWVNGKLISRVIQE